MRQSKPTPPEIAQTCPGSTRLRASFSQAEHDMKTAGSRCHAGAKTNRRVTTRLTMKVPSNSTTAKAYYARARSVVARCWERLKRRVPLRVDRYLVAAIVVMSI
jgi:hypothetical protein